MPLIRLSEGTLLVLLCCAVAAGTGDGDPAKRVEYFLKTPTGDLKPELIPYFMELDLESLPARLRDAYESKKAELLAVRKIADGKKKPFLRRLGAEGAKDCSPEEGTDKTLKILRIAGYKDLTENEFYRLLDDTACSRCELIDEFSVRVVTLPPKKNAGKAQTVAYFLHEKDPLWVLVGNYRSGRGKPFGTEFFGTALTPRCR